MDRECVHKGQNSVSSRLGSAMPSGAPWLRLGKLHRLGLAMFGAVSRNIQQGRKGGAHRPLQQNLCAPCHDCHIFMVCGSAARWEGTAIRRALSPPLLLRQNST